jgi:hypothetical protein
MVDSAFLKPVPAALYAGHNRFVQGVDRFRWRVEIDHGFTGRNVAQVPRKPAVIRNFNDVKPVLRADRRNGLAERPCASFFPAERSGNEQAFIKTFEKRRRGGTELPEMHRRIQISGTQRIPAENIYPMARGSQRVRHGEGIRGYAAVAIGGGVFGIDQCDAHNESAVRRSRYRFSGNKSR